MAVSANGSVTAHTTHDWDEFVKLTRAFRGIHQDAYGSQRLIDFIWRLEIMEPRADDSLTAWFFSTSEEELDIALWTGDMLSDVRIQRDPGSDQTLGVPRPVSWTWTYGPLQWASTTVKVADSNLEKVTLEAVDLLGTVRSWTLPYDYAAIGTPTTSFP